MLLRSIFLVACVIATPSPGRVDNPRQVENEDSLLAMLVAARSVDEQKHLLESNAGIVTGELFDKLVEKLTELYNSENYSKALLLSECLIEIAERLGDTERLGSATHDAGRAYYGLGQFPKAVEAYRRSLRIMQAAYQTSSRNGLAKALIDTATAYKEMGDYAKAEDHARQSLRLATDSGNEYGIALGLLTVGSIEVKKGNSQAALGDLRKSRELFLKLDQKGYLADALTEIGNVHLQASNYKQAFYHYNLALEAAKVLNHRRKKRRILTNLGILYTDQGEYEKASEHFEQSRQLAREMNDRVGAVKNLVNIAASNLMQNKYEIARKYYLESLEGAEALNLREWVVTSQQGLASVLAAQGEYEPALEWLNKSLQNAELMGNKPRMAILLWEIAKLHISQKSYPQAIEFADRAEAFADQIIPEISYLARTVKGRAYLAQKDYGRASDNLTRAIAGIEQIRNQVAGREIAKQVFFENKVEPYHAMIQLLMEQNNPKSWPEALYFAEQAKGRVLLDVLHHRKVNSGATANVAEQRRSERGQAQSVSHEEINLLLPDAESALLEFVTTGDNSYLFVMTKNENSGTSGGANVDLRVYELRISSEALSKLCNKFRDMLASQDTDFFTVSRQLHDLLLGPAEQQLRGRKTLCIVPDGPLWDLSFQSLRSTERRYVIEDYAVFYAPSLSVLREMKAKTLNSRSRGSAESMTAAANSTRLLAFGEPYFNDLSKAFVTSHQKKEAAILTSKEKEVLALLQFYGPENSAVFRKGQASEKLFKSLAGRYNVIHLATEGILDNRNPMRSYVELAKDPGDAGEDGKLEVAELMNLDLRAELVVMSACHTARGRIGAGEGLIGMSWALSVAGAPTTVVSHWKVESDSTSELMIRFHEQLLSTNSENGSGVSKAEAMRQAAIGLIKNLNYSHPFFWAGFSVVGDGASVYRQPSRGKGIALGSKTAK